MKPMSKACLPLSILGALLMACGGGPGSSGPDAGTAVGNGVLVDVKLRGYEQALQVPQMRFAHGVGVDAIFVSVGPLGLVPTARCQGGGPPQLPGPIVADLRSGGTLGGTTKFASADTSFCKMTLGFHPLSAAETPVAAAPLTGASIYVTGNVDNVPFTLRSSMAATLALVPGGGPLKLEGPNAHVVFVAFQLDAWFDNLDLGKLKNNPPIVVDAQHNPDQLAAFDQGVRESAHLFDDANGNGELESNEHGGGK